MVEKCPVGSSKAQNTLGTMYKHGKEFQNFQEAVKWFRLAAKREMPTYNII